MGYFKNISLLNFRNFDHFSINFSEDCNILVGPNGSGKTNVLEAISLFSKGLGIKKDKIRDIIKKSQNNFSITADFELRNISYNLKSQSTETTNGKLLKKISVNNDFSKEAVQNIYNSLSFLFFLPETERLFLSSPSNRRNFIDRFIFSYSTEYNILINKYNKNILERSKLLQSQNFDDEWLQRIEKNISEYGIEIYKLREKQVNANLHYLNIFINNYNLKYELSFILKDNFYNKNIDKDYYRKILYSSRQNDSLLGGSKIGPHKSDYIFHVNKNFPVSQLSTGQQKTLILLFYLSQCLYLKDSFQKKPILLLDEVCSHLDDTNRNILLTLIETLNLQTFMTGTTKDLFSFLSTNANFCNITY